VNVEGNPAGLEELRALGVPGVPAVALPDGRVVHGWNPPGYAALVGVEYRPPAKFSPAELAGRLDRILNLTDGSSWPCRPRRSRTSRPSGTAIC
jgi:hypothetical protein